MTFCKDVSWIGQRCSWGNAKLLAESKWYRLGSDYNDCDPQKVREESDWYRVINLFSSGDWDIYKWMHFFADIAWCNDRYWTSTPYKDTEWKTVKDTAYYRRLDGGYYKGFENGYAYKCCACGFKKSI